MSSITFDAFTDVRTPTGPSRREVSIADAAWIIKALPQVSENYTQQREQAYRGEHVTAYAAQPGGTLYASAERGEVRVWRRGSGQLVLTRKVGAVSALVQQLAMQLEAGR